MVAKNPELSDQEWQTILIALQRERRDLPSEIRRTQTSTTKEHLLQQRRDLDQIIRKLREAGVSPD
ncbi:MAG: hypothetical protein ACLFV3_08740 [Phycisphaeraceae bacterium]